MTRTKTPSGLPMGSMSPHVRMVRKLHNELSNGKTTNPKRRRKYRRLKRQGLIK